MAVPVSNVHATADVADSAVVAASSRVWHYAQSGSPLNRSEFG